MLCREIDSDNTAPPAFPLRVLYGFQPAEFSRDNGIRPPDRLALHQRQ